MDGTGPGSGPRFRAAVPSLPVSDERRAAAFYTGVLGFAELFDGDTPLAIFRRDAVELHVWSADGSAPGAEPELAGSASCRIEVTGIEALYATCRRAGSVHPNAPLTEQPWGTREFAVLDPDGNLVTFYERVP